MLGNPGHGYLSASDRGYAGLVGNQPTTVYLVGAGPGDPGLITVKGARLVRRCDVLVYDALAAPELVSASRAREKIYVGKTRGGHERSQEEINALLVALASTGESRRIVRLKGGDPFVFGRGGEELAACLAAGVACEVVPGVTAGLAAPAVLGVPATFRGLASGVSLVTAVPSAEGDGGPAWAALAASGLTLVFYMGAARIEAISTGLVSHGLDPATPALAIQEGTLPGMRVVAAPLADLARVASEAGIRPPAVVLVGRVAGLVDLHEVYRSRPLAGRTVVIACAEDSEYPEADRLRALGARIVELPVVRCFPLFGDAAVRAMVLALAPTDVMVLTSVRAAGFLVDACRIHRPDAPLSALAVLATTTRLAARIRDRYAATGEVPLGFGEILVPARAGSDHAAEALARGGIAAPRRVWLPRSSQARPALPESLRAHGYEPYEVALYDALPGMVPADVASLVRRGDVDALALTAGSCARALASAIPELVGNASPVPIVGAIGPRLAADARALGIACGVVPDTPEIGALLDAIAAELARSERRP